MIMALAWLLRDVCVYMSVGLGDIQTPWPLHGSIANYTLSIAIFTKSGDVRHMSSYYSYCRIAQPYVCVMKVLYLLSIAGRRITVEMQCTSNLIACTNLTIESEILKICAR